MWLWVAIGPGEDLAGGPGRRGARPRFAGRFGPGRCLARRKPLLHRQVAGPRATIDATSTYAGSHPPRWPTRLLRRKVVPANAGRTLLAQMGLTEVPKSPLSGQIVGRAR